MHYKRRCSNEKNADALLKHLSGRGSSRWENRRNTVVGRFLRLEKKRWWNDKTSDNRWCEFLSFQRLKLILTIGGAGRNDIVATGFV